MDPGLAIIAASFAFFAVGSYSIFFSAFLPLTGISVLDALALDKHYKYLAVLLIPTSTYFVIANWVGWQYYQNS
ncbi:hypothetical protein K523DRAFT_261697 [Schizophyllum commune Tattone D]|nr:hypothetical protein K523DRAFT_261697 [Schizophyllum commune Tattone D]